MKNKIFITLFLNLTYLSSYSQLDVSSASKDEIPYNKETGLVSINNILILPDANKSLKDIKAQIASFFETNQNGGTKKPNRLSKKNKDKLPQFSAGITLNQDSLII